MILAPLHNLILYLINLIIKFKHTIINTIIMIPLHCTQAIIVYENLVMQDDQHQIAVEDCPGVQVSTLEEGKYPGEENTCFGEEGKYSGEEGRYFGEEGKYTGEEGRCLGEEGKYSGEEDRYFGKEGRCFGEEDRYFGKEGRCFGKEGKLLVVEDKRMEDDHT